LNGGHLAEDETMKYELLSSALFGATFKLPPEILQAGQGEDEVTLDSVEVLVQILSDV
jgi:hypothetical protein